MTETPKQVAILALKRLLIELKEHRPDICIRCRLIGQMWMDAFLRVNSVTDRGVLLKSDTSNKFMAIADLSHIMQFEIDKPFQLYQPYFHYDVVTTGEW